MLTFHIPLNQGTHISLLMLALVYIVHFHHRNLHYYDVITEQRVYKMNECIVPW